VVLRYTIHISYTRLAGGSTPLRARNKPSCKFIVPLIVSEPNREVGFAKSKPAVPNHFQQRSKSQPLSPSGQSRGVQVFAARASHPVHQVGVSRSWRSQTHDDGMMPSHVAPVSDDRSAVARHSKWTHSSPPRRPAVVEPSSHSTAAPPCRMQPAENSSPSPPQPQHPSILPH
jgi:hypothetical protein